MTVRENLPLWDALLDAEMNVCYWSTVSRRLLAWDRRLKVIIAATSSGTALASLTVWQTHSAIWKLIACASCLISVYHSLIFSSERLKKSVALVATWLEVAERYQFLWSEDRELESLKAKREFERAKERETRGKLDEVHFERDEKLLLRSYFQVRKARGIDEQRKAIHST